MDFLMLFGLNVVVGKYEDRTYWIREDGSIDR